MTALRLVGERVAEITCDGCGAVAPAHRTTQYETRRANAKETGWMYRKGQDFCRSCATDTFGAP